MTYQELIELIQQYQAQGDLEGMQKAHDLLWNCDKSTFTEIQHERIWGQIFHLREDIWELLGLPPVTLGDDLNDFPSVDASKYNPEDIDG